MGRKETFQKVYKLQESSLNDTPRINQSILETMKKKISRLLLSVSTSFPSFLAPGLRCLLRKEVAADTQPPLRPAGYLSPNPSPKFLTPLQEAHLPSQGPKAATRGRFLPDHEVGDAKIREGLPSLNEFHLDFSQGERRDILVGLKDAGSQLQTFTKKE